MTQSPDRVDIPLTGIQQARTCGAVLEESKEKYLFFGSAFVTCTIGIASLVYFMHQSASTYQNKVISLQQVNRLHGQDDSFPSLGFAIVPMYKSTFCNARSEDVDKRNVSWNKTLLPFNATLFVPNMPNSYFVKTGYWHDGFQQWFDIKLPVKMHVDSFWNTKVVPSENFYFRYDDQEPVGPSKHFEFKVNQSKDYIGIPSLQLDADTKDDPWDILPFPLDPTQSSTRDDRASFQKSALSSWFVVPYSGDHGPNIQEALASVPDAGCYCDTCTIQPVTYSEALAATFPQGTFVNPYAFSATWQTVQESIWITSKVTKKAASFFSDFTFGMMGDAAPQPQVELIATTRNMAVDNTGQFVKPGIKIFPVREQEVYSETVSIKPQQALTSWFATFHAALAIFAYLYPSYCIAPMHFRYGKLAKRQFASTSIREAPVSVIETDHGASLAGTSA